MKGSSIGSRGFSVTLGDEVAIHPASIRFWRINMAPSCPHNVCVEVCIASLDDAFAASCGGADRLELNTALALGGLTPSLGVLRSVIQAVALPVITIIRPRPGGFAVSENDFKIMLADAEICLAEGAAGIAFGCLREDGRIDRQRCERMMRVMGGREAVFHRAFDVTPQPFEALEELIDLGVRRVLTSGQQPTAIEGAPLIATLVEQAKGRIEILPGSGIRPHNVKSLIAATGCTQVHGSLRSPRFDGSMKSRPGVRFAAALNSPEDQFDATDESLVRALCKAANERSES